MFTWLYPWLWFIGVLVMVIIAVSQSHDSQVARYLLLMMVCYSVVAIMAYTDYGKLEKASQSKIFHKATSTKIIKI